MTMKPAAARMPTVHIPTLRASTNSTNLGSLVGSTSSTSPATAWDAQNTVLIEDLVQGVQQCQIAAKRAQDTLRRQKSEDATSRRTRSPHPIAERKPWGANQTPRNRTSSPSKQPPTEKKAVSVVAPSAQPTTHRAASLHRSSTPDLVVTSDKSATQPKAALPSTRQSPPTVRPTSAAGGVQATTTSVGGARPKLQHHTPPAPTPRPSSTDSPSLSARSASSASRREGGAHLHASVVPPAAPRSAMLEAMMEETTQRVQRLETECRSAQERAKSAEDRCEQLEQTVRLLTLKFAQQQEDLIRLRDGVTQQRSSMAPAPQSAPHAYYQPQPAAAASLTTAAMMMQPSSLSISTTMPAAATAAPSTSSAVPPMQLHPYPFPVPVQRSVVPLMMPQQQPPQQPWWGVSPSSIQKDEEGEDAADHRYHRRDDDDVSSNDDRHVARRLDLSSDSSKSVTRVPPQPPLNLRLA